MESLICPFCNEPMKVVGEMFMCHKDNYFVSPKSRTAMFSAGAPKHLQESWRFIKTFRRVRPKFVFSSVPLWEEGFVEDKVKFVQCKHPTEAVSNYRLDQINVVKDIKEGHLIAGRNILSDDLRAFFTQAVLQKADKNPLDLKEFPEPETWLWIKTILHSCKMNVNTNTWRAIGMYFSVCPEQMLSFAEGDLQFGLSTIPYTDEAMLYAYISAMPDINVKWAAGAEGLSKNCLNFVKFLTRQLKSLDESDTNWKIDRFPEKCRNNKMFWDSMSLFLHSMPSTAVNISGKTISTYDFMDNNFKVDALEPISSPNPDLNEIMAFQCADKILAELYDKYGAPYTASVNLDEKANFCRLNGVDVDTSNGNEIVIRFWETIRKKFEEADTNENK